MAETPINYFSEGSPGKGLSEGVEDEKMKLLRLIAEHGTTGQRIYNEAASRVRKERASGVEKATKGAINVPVGTIAEVAQEFDASLSLYENIIEDNARAAERDRVRRQSIEAIYKDSVAGDASLEANAQTMIDRFMEDQARARRGGGGGGGGGLPARPTTLPAGYFDHDPTRVIGYDPDYHAATGTAAPPVSLDRLADAVAGASSAPAPAELMPYTQGSALFSGQDSSQNQTRRSGGGKAPMVK